MCPWGGGGGQTNQFFAVLVATALVNLLSGGDNPRGIDGLKEVD